MGFTLAFKSVRHGFLRTVQSLDDTSNARMIGSVRHCLAGLDLLIPHRLRLILSVLVPSDGPAWQSHSRFQLPVEYLLRDAIIWHSYKVPAHPNCAYKRSASMPEILQVCRTSTLVVRSCHLIPAIFHRQRRWNWSSLRTWHR